jgi:hypothetical protein
MQTPSEADFLTLWEIGVRRHPIDQALLLGAWARPDLTPEHLADLPLGVVNAALLRLRQACFGSRIEVYVDCEQCNERLELALETTELLAGLEQGTSQKEFELAGLRLRAPCWRDLAQIAGESQPEQAARRLLERCCIEPPADASSDLASLTDEIESALSRLDPGIEFLLALHCEVCGHRWRANLDVRGLLWDELDAHARALLGEVHSLALAYGWSEADILALSPQRRAAYLQRVSP